MRASTIAGTGRGAVRVFLISGYALLRDGLRELLSDEGFEVVGEAPSIASALPGAVEAVPDVALIENRLPDGTGIEACRALGSAVPRTGCVILTTFAEEKALRSVVLAGAAGYVLQSASADGLPEAVRRVAVGERLHSPQAAQAALVALAAEPVRREATATEDAVLSLMLQGMTNAQIAAELALSDEILAGHLSSLLARLGYRSAPASPLSAPEEPGQSHRAPSGLQA